GSDMKITHLLIAVGLVVSVFACSSDSDNGGNNNPGDGGTGAGSPLPEGGDEGGGGQGGGGGTGAGPSGGGGSGGDPEQCVNDGNFAECQYPGNPAACKNCNECYCTGACVAIFNGPQGDETLECMDECGNDVDCQMDCYDAHPEAGARFNQWYSCLKNKCGTPCGIEPGGCEWGWKDKTECNNCWHDACECIPMSTWNEFVGCLQACEENDDPCEEACYTTHTEAADLIDCVYNECRTPCSFLFGP
ncbi:MAG: hypothetical protein FWD57_08355, partial [Polyangiaceae bacterium]|nr:hypothetical protein [Polyangiaceae bacterium]